MNKLFFFGKKKIEYYDGLIVKADLGLHNQIADVVRREIPYPNASILDFGAGEGALSARLSDLSYDITAVDKDAEDFKCKSVEFFYVNFDLLEEIGAFVAGHQSEFDAVLSVEVIEHVQDPWQYVRHLLKMVKPGGLVLITTPNITSWLSRLSFFLTGRFHQFGDDDLSYGHINPISSWELSLVLREAGAVNITISPAGTLPPIYLTGFNKVSFMSLLLLPFRPLLRGIIDGWCVIATARKPL